MESLYILHLEDEPLDSELVRVTLEQEGLPARLERVQDMRAFQHALESGPYALILADYTLPGMDALEALRWARTHRPELPFILVSGTMGEEAAIEALKLGATDYVLKQRLGRLGPAVRRALQQAEERRQHHQAEAELRAQKAREIATHQEAERALQDAELRVRLAAEATSLGTFDYYPQTGQLFWSERVKRHFGLPPEAEVSYDTFLRGLHPADRERVHQQVQEALKPEQGGHLRLEYRTVGLQDRRERWLEVFGQTYFDQHGRPIRLVGATRDITQRKQAEAALRQSEEAQRVAAEELQAIMDAAPAGLLVAHDPECHLMTGNGPAHEALGVPPSENITATPPGQKHSRYFRIFRHGQEVLGLELPMQKAAATGAIVHDQELEVLRRDGTRRTVLITATPLYAADGRIRGAVGALVDITERKQAEGALRQSEQKFRAVFEQAAIGIGRVRFSDARWIDVNEAFCRMLGYTAEELRATPWPQITHPEDVNSDLEPFRRMASGEIDYYNIEKRFIRKDGHPVWARLTLSLVRDAQGRPEYEIAIIEDVTQRKQAEALLKAALRAVELERLRLEAVLEALPAGIAIADEHGKVRQFNAALSRIWGKPPIPASVEQYGHWRGRWADTGQPLAAEDWAMARTLRTGEVVTGDVVEIEKFDGSGKAVILNAAAPIRDISGRVIGGVVAEVDITAQKQAEAALKQAREDLARANAELERRVQERTAELQATIAELEQMSYSMIHDLRAPLRAIQSFGGIVAEDPDNRLTRESRDMIAKMRTAADRMDYLVRDMLNYSRVVREALPLEPVDVGALVRGIVETYPNLYASAAQVSVAGAFPPVLGNPAALTQCLSQLLSNAVKFTQPDQKPRIQVWGETTPEGWVRIVVADNGIGIASHLRERVFGMFQQLRPSEEGTGMGLTIVKKAVERMGGRVGVDSEPGAGSRFWFELKAAAPVAQAARSTEPSQKAA